jgi:L-glyceraldehyde 3-phosphate reductase
MSERMLTEEALGRVRSLNEIARARGQSLAQLALSWVLRDERVTSVLIGASSLAQLEANVGALDSAPLTDAELGEIDRYALEGDINLWQASSAV